MPVYKKLVRDKIPQMIEESGKSFTMSILPPDKRLGEIKNKMKEEAIEFQEATNKQDTVEELADIVELVHAALDVYGISYEELEAFRQRKKEKRGGFAEGIYLMEVED